jgi:2-methylcitrate dehydratase PrpD
MQTLVETGKEEVTAMLSRFIAETKYEDLPPAITDRVKKSILDTIGIIMPASELMHDLRPAIELYIEAGGKEESTVLGYGVKLPSAAATFANGVRGHALDYADGHLEAVFRIGIATIPAALALAERKGTVSGREFITAVAVAEEFLCRLGVSNARRRTTMGPWHEGILFGNFGATAAAARMLDLTAEQTDRAFGIAFLKVGGTLSVVNPDANVRGMYAGFVGETGVRAAQLAQKGIQGPRGCLESKGGLFDVHLRGIYDRESLLGGLGREFELVNLSFKPWPACAFAHPFIDAMLSLRSEHSIRTEDIEKIDVSYGAVVKKLELCNPIDVASGRVPRTDNDGKRSIPFNVALAALKGKISLRDFNSEGLRDQEVLKLAEKVRGTLDPDFDAEQFTRKGTQLPPGRVAVTNRRGQTFTKRVDIPYGHHQNPMKFEDLVDKFRDCLSLSSKPMSAQDTERVIEMILHLEDVADVREIVKLLA